MTNKKNQSKIKQIFLKKKKPIMFAVGFGLVGIMALAQILAATSTYTPMTVTKSDFHPGQDPGGIKAQYNCEGTDDSYYWSVAGSLNPGESYTFNPPKTICSKNEARFTSANVAWDASNIELTTLNPVTGALITGVQAGMQASVCTMNDVNFSSTAPPTMPYSFTIKNVGNQTAYNVNLNGQSHNGWMNNLMPVCFRSDADHDGWNDALEYAMTTVIDNTTYAPPLNSGVFWSDYYRATGTPEPFDETDYYPPDIDNDGQVTQADYDLMNRYVGQGDGVSLDMVSPNPGDPDFYYNERKPWRRFDLNGDGYVNQLDLNWEQKLIGKPNSYGATNDVLPPVVIVRAPATNGVVRIGSNISIFASVLDNGYLTNVEYFVNGTKLNCPAFNLTPRGNEYVNGQFDCNWIVPKKSGAIYTITVKGTDKGGNTTSASSSNVKAVR